MHSNYYKVLGISNSATHDEIKIAYRKEAFKYHPDRNPDKADASSKMKELNFIYSVLSDPEKRKSYDESFELFNDTEYQYDSYDSYIDIFCNEIEIIDSYGNYSIIKNGQDIFYLVEIDKTIITWKYKSKEYFNLTINKIFDPEKKEHFIKRIKYDIKKTPLFLVHIGEQDLIIYKEDFVNNWLSEKTYKTLDKKKGVITGIVVAFLILLIGYYFFYKFEIPEESKFLIDFSIDEKYNILHEDIEFLKDAYSVSENELKYIDTEYYLVCTKILVKTIKEAEILTIPDSYGLKVGIVPETEEVEVFLYCPSKNGYKVKYKNLFGWTSKNNLEIFECENIFKSIDESE